MSVWIEEKYIGLVGSQLDRFHRQSRTTYAFRCPYCGDSQKQSNKTRGYFFLYHREYFFKCHNCNVSVSLRTFLRQRHPDLYREYQLDVLRQDRPSVELVTTPEASTMLGFGKKKLKMSLPSIASLASDHPAVLYCKGRGLPEASLPHLHFSDHWTDWIKETGWSYALPEDHGPRLILPWYNRQQELIGAQARRIDATGQGGRYVTLKGEHVTDKIYGWDRVDFHQKIHVVEGPIDSWFLPNCVASMDSDLLRMHDTYFSRHTAVYIWDNEPRNLAVVKNVKDAIKRGLPVVIWPPTLKEKDLNDMSQAGHNVEDLVRQHTYRGLRAELEFLRWKKS